MRKRFEELPEKVARHIARSTSRRGFVGRLSTALLGGAIMPLLPVGRAFGQETGDKTQSSQQPRNSFPGSVSSNSQASPSSNGFPGVAPQPAANPAEAGDISACDYWRYCGIAGTLCACCGGGPATCPPGTEMSPMGWIGTCRNPVDGKSYIISYNDCCGKPNCTRCRCGPVNPNDKPQVRPQSSSGYLWCLGTSSASYTCSTAVVLGTALGPSQ